MSEREQVGVMRWSGRRCPKCQAEIITDGVHDVCSLVGCDYGVMSEVLAPAPITQEGEG